MYEYSKLDLLQLISFSLHVLPGFDFFNLLFHIPFLYSVYCALMSLKLELILGSCEDLNWLIQMQIKTYQYLHRVVCGQQKTDIPIILFLIATMRWLMGFCWTHNFCSSHRQKAQLGSHYPAVAGAVVMTLPGPGQLDFNHAWLDPILTELLQQALCEAAFGANTKVIAEC